MTTSPDARALSGLRVLVTGGAGYIGSHTLVELIAAGCEVAVVDNFATSHPEALARVGAIAGVGIEVRHVDMRDAAALEGALADLRPEAVIHFAGLKAVGESEAEPLLYHHVNVTGTLHLLQAMTQAGCGRLVFSSSATVYGDPVYLPYDESHPLAPASVYGRTKLMAESLIRDWAGATPGATAMLLRYFNPAGAHASARIGEDPQGVPNNLMPYLAQVASGRRAALRIFGDDYDTPDGTGVRDYIHITDLAEAHVAALAHAVSATGVETLNIGTGRGTSVREMLAAFAAAVGRDLPHDIAPRRAGDIAAMLADPGRARDVLGWTARLGLEAMCQSTWAWQSRNPSGYGGWNGGPLTEE